MKFYRLRDLIECGDTDGAIAYLDHYEPLLNKVVVRESEQGEQIARLKMELKETSEFIVRYYTPQTERAICTTCRLLTLDDVCRECSALEECIQCPYCCGCAG